LPWTQLKRGQCLWRMIERYWTEAAGISRSKGSQGRLNLS
jgi:hypothetical protein